jgi:hypothetical protein
LGFYGRSSAKRAARRTWGKRRPVTDGPPEQALITCSADLAENHPHFLSLDNFDAFLRRNSTENPLPELLNQFENPSSYHQLHDFEFLTSHHLVASPS